MHTRVLPFEIKSIADSGAIEGIISAFGGVDTYGDTIQPGAYTKSIASIAQSGRKMPVLYQHDASRPIGVWTELVERPQGLFGKADLAMDVELAREAHALAKIGALTGISIGFDVAPGGSKQDGNLRLLTEINLWEASLVTFPADPQARVTSIKELPRDVDQVREFLRQQGFASRDAAAMAGAWKARREQSNNHDAAEAVLRGAIARLGNL
ncbi:HK97 family phage prohead protease [Allopontixanthobacter sediminis]|uniref:HK97 family phage prohead protease n=1 Tax=Allopontixanthobacter sediminis TaxID=1689985 RepID=A0A845B0M2_9SPHN|nr:HK97 family phage prohead protease [Allopontixanthobacter sediminis]MXP43694.1 HK97 family phage prohead protease [Allopontixanthobacter sediminis]